MKQNKVDKSENLLHRNILYKFLSFLLYIVAIIILPYLTLINYNIRVYGKRKLRKIKGGAIITPTHNLALDCAITGAQICFPQKIPYIITMEKNLKIPIIGTIIKSLRGIGVPNSINAKREFLNTLNNLLEANNWIILYPEGNLISFKKELEPFKRGAFKMSCETNVPIIPVVYTYRKPKGIFAFRKKPYISGYILNPQYPDPSLTKEEQHKELKLRCETLMNRCFQEKNETYYDKKDRLFNIEDLY